MRRRTALLSVFLVLAVSIGAAPAWTGPAVLTVQIAGVATKTILHLQPGFATILRADHRIDTVAIGDPRLVTATVVKRQQDAYDLVLQPQVEIGATNMVVWFGTLTTIWELNVGPGQRTADIVYVVTAPAHPSSEPTTGSLPPPAPAQKPGSDRPSSPAPEPGTSTVPSTGPSVLEIHQTEGNVAATFQALRARDGVYIRYHISNGSDTDLTLRPGSVLVRVNGRIVPYGMARDSADRGRPEILPKGATETGVIDAPGRAPQRVQLILSLFPVPVHGQTRGVVLPFTFQATFSGVDRLMVSSDP